MIIEDGTGIENANSYVTSDEADAYFAALGNTDWYSDEAALITASQAADLLYAQRYLGSRLTLEQGLAFPRSEFSDNEGFVRPEGTIPVELKRTVFELALNHLKGDDLVPNPDGDTMLQEHTVKLDVLEETKIYFGPQGAKRSRKADLLIANIINKSIPSSQRRIIRG